MKTDKQSRVEIIVNYTIKSEHVYNKNYLSPKGFRDLKEEASNTSFGLLAELSEKKECDNIEIYKAFVSKYSTPIFEWVKNSIDGYLDKPDMDISGPITVIFTFESIGKNTILTVADNGCGIDEKLLTSKDSHKQGLPNGARLGGAKKGNKDNEKTFQEEGGSITLKNRPEGGGASVTASVPTEVLEAYIKQNEIEDEPESEDENEEIFTEKVPQGFQSLSVVTGQEFEDDKEETPLKGLSLGLSTTPGKKDSPVGSLYSLFSPKNGGVKSSTEQNTREQDSNIQAQSMVISPAASS